MAAGQDAVRVEYHVCLLLGSQIARDGTGEKWSRPLWKRGLKGTGPWSLRDPPTIPVPQGPLFMEATSPLVAEGCPSSLPQLGHEAARHSCVLMNSQMESRRGTAVPNGILSL